MNSPSTPKGKFSTPFTSGNLGGMSGGGSAGKTSAPGGSGPTKGGSMLAGAKSAKKFLPKAPSSRGKV